MRKKSKYRPKTVRTDNMGWIKAGFTPVAQVPTAGLVLRALNLSALDSLVLGKGTGEDSHALREAFVMALCLTKINPKLGADWVPELQAAKAASFAMHERGERTGRFLFTGPEMQAVKEGMRIHAQQLEECTVKEMEQGIDLAISTKGQA
jgi:hypothetical protein